MVLLMVSFPFCLRDPLCSPCYAATRGELGPCQRGCSFLFFFFLAVTGCCHFVFFSFARFIWIPPFLSFFFLACRPLFLLLFCPDLVCFAVLPSLPDFSLGAFVCGVGRDTEICVFICAGLRLCPMIKALFPFLPLAPFLPRLIPSDCAPTILGFALLSFCFSPAWFQFLVLCRDGWTDRQFCKFVPPRSLSPPSLFLFPPVDPDDPLL